METLHIETRFILKYFNLPDFRSSANATGGGSSLAGKHGGLHGEGHCKSIQDLI